MYGFLDQRRKGGLPELFDPMKFKQNEDTHNEILDEWLTQGSVLYDEIQVEFEHVVPQ